MRIAWFSPLPPTRSGIAVYSANVVPRLATAHHVDCFTEANAFEFAWRARQSPYDLVVYQLGNAPCHDYMWAYLVAHPGLVILHDARLHQARARRLLNQRRFDDYRREFRYDHPDAPRDFAEYAVEGLGGPVYYLWGMLRVVVRTARMIAVHSPRVADDLRAEFAGAAVDTIRLGVAAGSTDEAARTATRAALGIPADAVLFAAFGKITAEKRIEPIVRAFDVLAGERSDVHLLVAGDASDYGEFQSVLAATRHADRVHVTGYVPDREVNAYLLAADACLCLRWPTALESSASWLQCLAAGRATLISDLPHLADIPTSAPHGQPFPFTGREPVAMAIDLLEEDTALLGALRRLAEDRALRESLGRAGRAYWAEDHTLEATAEDYERVMIDAVQRSVPAVADLPAHFTDDHTGRARNIAEHFGLALPW